MKRTTILTTLLAALLGSYASGQTAVTDPVGFVTVTAPANSDAPVGLPVARAAVLQTTVSSVSANEITVAAAMTSSQFVYASPTQTNHYYVSVKSTVSPSSAVKGKWYEIVSNSTSSITVDSGSATSVQSQGLAVGDTIEVIPFWTLNTLLPSGQSMTVTTDIDFPQDLILQLPQTVAGINLASAKSAIYSTDTANLGVAGWYNANTFDAVGDDLILPDTYLVFRNKGAAQPVTIVGSVPMASAKATTLVRLSGVLRQDNFAINPFPIPVSLTELGLFETGVFQATTDIDFPKDILLVYQGNETGFNSQPAKSYIYSTDTVNLPSAGWYDSSTFDGPYLLADKLVPAGGAIIIRKALGAISEANWAATRPY